MNPLTRFLRKDGIFSPAERLGLFLGLLSLILFASAPVTFRALSQAQTSLRESQVQALRLASALRHARMEEILRGWRTDVRLMASILDHQIEAETSPYPVSHEPLLASMTKDLPWVTRVRVFDTQMRPIHDHQPRGAPAPTHLFGSTHRPYPTFPRSALEDLEGNEIYLSDIFLGPPPTPEERPIADRSPLFQRRLVEMGQRILTTNGEHRGYLLVDFCLNALLQQLHQEGEVGVSFLVNRASEILPFRDGNPLEPSSELVNPIRRLLQESVLEFAFHTESMPVWRQEGLYFLHRIHADHADPESYWLLVSFLDRQGLAADHPPGLPPALRWVFAALILGLLGSLLEGRLSHLLEQRDLALKGTRVAVQESTERLQTRISRDLHDGLGQRLQVLCLLIGECQDCFPEETRRQVDRELEEAVREVRAAADALRPSSSLYHEWGLIPALEREIARLSKTNEIRFDLEVTPRDDFLEVSTEEGLALIRIFQEAVANALHHAQPKQISILLQGLPGKLVLIVEDDGKGFDSDQLHLSGADHPFLGLVSMRERARELGGQFHLESSPGQGTMIRVTLPRKRKEEA